MYGVPMYFAQACDTAVPIAPLSVIRYIWSPEKLEEKAELMKKNNYGKYLRKVLDIRKR